MNTFPYVVADIGGTNARFGIVTGTKDQHQRLTVNQQQVYPCSEFASFDDVFAQYLSTLDEKPHHACIAIAGPVIGDDVQMTNLSWSISSDSLRKAFDLNQIKLINDFGALAYVTLMLKDHELAVIYYGKTKHDVDRNANRLILGAGTGLGVAGLVKTSNTWQPVCGEGGHVSFAALDKHQIELRDALLSLSENTTHLSVENILSGPGLINLYRAHCVLDGVTEQAFTPSDVSTFASDKSDQQCVKALQDFSRILGATAGDAALTMGAFGGVYLSGGILPKILSCLDKQALIDAYLAKGLKRSLLETVPIYLVSSPMPALVGAAHLLHDTILSD